MIEKAPPNIIFQRGQLNIQLSFQERACRRVRIVWSFALIAYLAWRFTPELRAGA